ncbi:MAG: CRTAC1 family protein [Planctomycetota bacterium]
MLFAVVFSTAATAQIQFSDQSASAGLNFSHAVTLNLPTMLGDMNAGGTVGDFNHDGWPDLFLLGGGDRADALYLNNADGTFTDFANAWGVDALHHGFGAAAADYDGDGYVDIFVSSLGLASGPPTPGMHRLYHNDGGTGFTEVAVSAGVATTTVSIATGSSALFGDYDNDGDLDLFVCAGQQFTGHSNVLFQNQGDGTFLDVTVSCGADAAGSMGFAGGIVNLDADLSPEIVCIADWGGSRLFANQGDSTFLPMAVEPPQFQIINGMGNAFADFDNNLLIDIYASAIYPIPGNVLLHNQGGLVFTDDSISAGVDDADWGWGPAAIDVNNDGWLDIAAANGWSGIRAATPTRLFVNQQDGTYSEEAVAAGLTDPGQGRTLLRLDYDRDGDNDLVLLSNKGQVRLYRNDSGIAAGNWLQLELETSANPDIAPAGIGAMVYFRLGDAWRLRQLDNASSYQGTHEPLIHLGLGSAQKVDEVRVEWSDGSLTYLGHTQANQRITLAAGPPLDVDVLYRGQPATMSIRNTLANRPVAFLYAPQGTGLGNAQGFGQLQLDLVGPITVLGLAMSDAQGNASFTSDVPLLAPLGEIGLQAVTLAGPFAGHSIKTNALLREVLP